MLKTLTASRCLAGLGLSICLLQAVAQPAFDIPGGGGPFHLHTLSQKAARFAATVRQQYDFSCGSAAVATLLSFHYGMPTREQAAFDEMFAHGDQARIRTEGFSLLDLKRFLATRGFEADGFELPLEKLAEAHIPAIVLIAENGFNHFVVVKGLREGRVLIGDPIGGTRVVARPRFDALWKSRLLFVIHNRQARAVFNDIAEWNRVPRAPLASGISRNGLELLTLPRLGPNEL